LIGEHYKVTSSSVSATCSSSIVCYI